MSLPTMAMPWPHSRQPTFKAAGKVHQIRYLNEDGEIKKSRGAKRIAFLLRHVGQCLTAVQVSNCDSWAPMVTPLPDDPVMDAEAFHQTCARQRSPAARAGPG